MTSENFQGVSLEDQIQQVESEYDLLAKKKKELNELKQLRDDIKIEVIKELERIYNFEVFNENMSNFIEKFDDFLVSLDDYIKISSDTSKASLLEKIPILRDISNFMKDIGDG